MTKLEELSEKELEYLLKQKRRKKRIEFSKLILTCVSLATTIIVVFSMLLMWRTGDASGLAYLIPAVFAELATATGFYYNKAKAENIRKIEGSSVNEEY